MTTVVLRVDPSLAEAAVFRAGANPGSAGPAELAAHQRRAEPLYAIRDPAERDAAFGRLALAEFEALELAGPLRRAVAERVAVAARVRVILLGEARSRTDEGVTCEPGGQQLGIRIETARLDDPERLLGWARHALGHAEDTLDPAFAFVRGWEGTGGGRVPSATQGRLHRLWDVTVDAALARAGHLDPNATLWRHEAVLAADLPSIAPASIGAVVTHLWAGERPTFPTLLGWAARPTELLRLALPTETGLPRPDHCPLCGFPSDDVACPDARLTALIAAEYPAWRPEDGLCGRCTDRYRFAGALGGRR